MSESPQPLTDYIAAAPEPARAVLEHFHRRALALAPDAEEATSYGMPSLRYRGKSLVAVRITGSGYSVYPCSGTVVEKIGHLAEGLSMSKGAIRFSDAHPLSDDAFDALVAERMDEIDGRS
ncbi:DUF1801 domain-containing protein [Chryseoglobus sp. 28M-23]|uniref:iron chaperone n=1 Tax=Chryseoglobus sp. 28M-23 TaxID=2772253 RepID=UPI00174665B0|nr:DUF1801 domain-containing protein [Chryseoglobus sp. 28M-23]QOD94016.1 DUF1801 domain-containing protein [Chryseoglobus sp. 28M-23]